MVQYPIVLERDDGTIMVTFPDFPETHTFGADRDEALMRAPDALATIIDAYIRDRRDLPTPSPIKRTTATLSALMSAKVELYRAMRAAGVTKSELARRLDWHLPQVDRLLDLRHGSQLDQLEAAAKAVGCFLDVNFHTSSRPNLRLTDLVRKAQRRTTQNRKAANRIFARRVAAGTAGAAVRMIKKHQKTLKG